ncbi:MAG: alpha-glucan family phosphorylase [Candidatus Omnitrophica bacterium]|nr:alpha-glucan family phosphorylase [Candidatus Omnitrophota bacterium]
MVFRRDCFVNLAAAIFFLLNAACAEGSNLRIPIKSSDRMEKMKTIVELDLSKITPDTVRKDFFDISQNLWFQWNYKAGELFEIMDNDLWNSKEVSETPFLFLEHLGKDKISELIKNKDFLLAYADLTRSFREYMDPSKETWCGVNYPEIKDDVVAYFSLELGVFQNLQSGGLGALAGDHLREMSDKGIKGIGIGLCYKNGYFTQRISAEGEQEEYYSDDDFLKLPKKEVVGKDGKPLVLEFFMYSMVVHAKVWEVNVGRIKLYLMDTDIEQNEEWVRAITSKLYSGDHKIDLYQSYLLGIGGSMLFEELGIKPSFLHLNESHAGFVMVSLIKDMMDKEGLSFEEALVKVYYKSLFTLHTPIDDGNWKFDIGEMRYLFSYYLKGREKEIEKVFALGKQGNVFNMAKFLLNTSRLRNGVSEEHGGVARKLWQGHVIGEVLNGINLPYWQSPGMQKLIADKVDEVINTTAFDKINLQDDVAIKAVLNEAINRISDGELWETHKEYKNKLVDFVRVSVKAQRERNNESAERIAEAEKLLDPDALTIVVARRFATYKRSDWIFSGDFERIKRILKEAKDSGKPVQIIFAGKAHPTDTGGGKEIIKNIHRHIKNLENSGIEGQVIFLENYNLDMAHYLVQGADIWLSYPEITPVPKEASATSGQKHCVSGGINAGIPTGFMRKWMVNHVNAILFRDIHDFYRELEEFIIPQYNMRSHKWLSVMRESLRVGVIHFGTDRMLGDYVEKYYAPGIESSRPLGNEYLKKVAGQVKGQEALLKEVKFLKQPPANFTAQYRNDGTIEPVKVRAVIGLGEILPEAVEVSILLKQNGLVETQAIQMTRVREEGSGAFSYEGIIDPLLGNFVSESRSFILDKKEVLRFKVRIRPIINLNMAQNWPERISDAESAIEMRAVSSVTEMIRGMEKVYTDI